MFTQRYNVWLLAKESKNGITSNDVVEAFPNITLIAASRHLCTIYRSNSLTRKPERRVGIGCGPKYRYKAIGDGPQKYMGGPNAKPNEKPFVAPPPPLPIFGWLSMATPCKN